MFICGYAQKLRLSEFECPAAIEELEQVAFVRLVPGDLRRADGAEVQPVDQRRLEQGRTESRVLSDGGDYNLDPA